MSPDAKILCIDPFQWPFLYHGKSWFYKRFCDRSIKVNILAWCSDLYSYENDTSHSSPFPITIIHIVKGKKEKQLVNILD